MVCGLVFKKTDFKKWLLGLIDFKFDCFIVGWGCKIHQLNLCLRAECQGYDI